MDPVTMKLRFFLEEEKRPLTADEWTELLTKCVSKTVEKIKIGSSCNFLCEALVKLLAACDEDRSLVYDAGQICNLSSLVPLLCNRIVVGSCPSAECLAQILKHFGGACGPFKDSIKGTLEKAVDVQLSSDSFTYACGDCWAFLPFVGGSGAKGAHHKENWRTLARESLISLHETLSSLFNQIPGAMSTPFITGSGLKLEKLPFNNHQRLIAGLVQRFSTVAEYFTSMLSVDTPVSVDLPIHLALLVVERALSIGNDALSIQAPENPKKKSPFKQSTFLRILAKHLPDIYRSALRILRAIILCCGGVPLLEFSRPIGRILANAFEMTIHRDHENLDETWKPSSSSVRSARQEAYSCLESWIEASKAVAFPKNSQTSDSPLVRIWRSVWKDFTIPSGYSLVATTGKKPYDEVDEEAIELWGLSKKERKQRKRKMGMDAAPGGPGGKKRLKSRGNEPVSLVGLDACDGIASASFLRSCRCFQILSQFCGARLSSEMYSDLSDKLLQMLTSVHIPDCGGKSVVGMLHRRHDCRLSAYELLLSIATTPPALNQWPLPSSAVVSVFSRGTNDPDPDVSAFCSSCLKICSSALMRAPGLTMQWVRRVPMMDSERSHPSHAVGLAIDAISTSAPKIDARITFESDEPFETEPPVESDRMSIDEDVQVLSVESNEAVAQVRQSPREKRKKKKSAQKRISEDAEEDDEVVEIVDADHVRFSDMSLKEVSRTPPAPVRVPETSKSQVTAPVPVREEFNSSDSIGHLPREPRDDLPSVLDMLAAFMDS